MSDPTLDPVIAAAHRQAAAGASADDSAGDLLVAAGGDRRRLEQARDEVASRMHTRSDDFELGATLQMLNRVLGALPIDDPLDWRKRWHQRFRKP